MSGLADWRLHWDRAEHRLSIVACLSDRACIQLTVACASSYERACLSHRALLRMSATLIEPLLLLKANRLQ